MKQIALAALGAAALAGCAGPADTAAEPTREALVERGRYIVEGVGLCGDCHTQRLPTGALDDEHKLQGATLDFAPTIEIPVWADVSPGLAGTLAGYSEEDFVAFLVAGSVRADGSAPRPPMPSFKLNEDDARAVTAYLASLPAE